MENSESHHKKDLGVLPTYAGGGPQGLGDPNDRSIRKIENELITQKMRDESKKLCPEEDKVFADCLRTGGFFFFVRCYEAGNVLKRCQLNWFHNEEFRHKVTEKYLDERAEFRQTGITKYHRDWDKKMEKEFEVWSKEHKHKNEQTDSSTS